MAGAGSWAQLVAREHRGAMAVLSGGTLMFAVDTYITASLMPSAVAEIGGEAFYAWPTTVFLLAAVVTSALVSRVLATVPAARAYLVALAVFAAGALVGALASSMAVFLVGRLLQGVGGGLLAGMGYALIRVSLPRTLWTRGSAVIATMWGVALVVGPGLGGVLAGAGLWRWAFGVLVVAALAIAAIVPSALHRTRARIAPGPFPLGSVLYVGAAAAVLSVAGLAADVRVAGAGLAAAVVLIVLFLRHERRTTAAVLPRATFRPGSALPWILRAERRARRGGRARGVRASRRAARRRPRADRRRVPGRRPRRRVGRRRDRQRVRPSAPGPGAPRPGAPRGRHRRRRGHPARLDGPFAPWASGPRGSPRAGSASGRRGRTSPPPRSGVRTTTPISTPPPVRRPTRARPTRPRRR